jgi:internalin A
MSRSRKGIRWAALLAAMMILAFSSCSQPDPDSEDYVIAWADAGMENAVRQKLNKPTGDITRSELNILKIVHIWPDKVQFNSADVVELDNVRIEKADDLHHFVNLYGVLLNDMPYEDLSVLEGLNQLQRVILQENDFLTDIRALAAMPKLVTLVISANKSLADFSPLSEISTLIEVDLHSCNLTDIEFLRPLTKLKRLILHSNYVQDLSPLENSANMQELDIHANSVADIRTLASFPNLFKLKADGNLIGDLSPLSDHIDMRTLNFDDNEISNLSPLYDLQELRKVTLDGNPLSAAEVAALRARLPSSCEIVWEADA